MAFRTDKLSESQVHETLYKNVLMLMQLHQPQNEDIKNVLKKDMFVKNNRAAFNHVTYYLLRVLNPSVIQEKVKSWPIFDPQYERQFRTEVMKYLNELNEVYENANMPLILASQLVSPGGLKFAKYMLKLSILVMIQCARKNEGLQEKMLLKPNLLKNPENAKRQIIKLNVLTKHIDIETRKLNLDFHNKFTEYIEIANTIMEKLNEMQRDLPLLQNELQLVHSIKTEDDSNLEIINEKIGSLTRKLTNIEENDNRLRKIRDLVIYLTKNDLCLESNTCDEMDLKSTFENLNLEMKKHCLEMTTCTDLQLNCYIEKFGKCNEELNNLYKHWVAIHQECVKMSGDLKTTAPSAINNFTPTSSSKDSAVLAVPLVDSISL